MQNKRLEGIVKRDHFFYSKKYQMILYDDHLEMKDVYLDFKQQYIYRLIPIKKLNIMFPQIYVQQYIGKRRLVMDRSSQLALDSYTTIKQNSLSQTPNYFMSCLIRYHLKQHPKVFWISINKVNLLEKDKVVMQILVYRITNKIKETTLAGKLFKKESMNNFKMKICQSIQLKEIVQFKGVFEHNDKLILIYEYIDGKTLQDLTQFEYLSKNNIKKIMKVNYYILQQILKQLIQTLCYLHSKKIVHGDLNLHNVMVMKDYTIKIIDFGFSFWESKNKKENNKKSGTPGFYSPEILNKKTKSCISDMFSLGAIFHYLLNKEYLFNGEDTDEIIQKNKKCQFDENMFKNFDQQEKDLLQKLLEVNESKRITAEEACKHPYVQG